MAELKTKPSSSPPAEQPYSKKDKILSPFCIRSNDGRSFYTSPYVLARHSAVFRTMFDNPKIIDAGIDENQSGDQIETWLLAFHEYGKKNTIPPTRHGGSFVVLCDKYAMDTLLSKFKLTVGSLIPKDNACMVTMAATTNLFKDMEAVIMMWVFDGLVPDGIIHSLPAPFIAMCMKRGKKECERQILALTSNLNARGFGGTTSTFGTRPTSFVSPQIASATFGSSSSSSSSSSRAPKRRKPNAS